MHESRPKGTQLRFRQPGERFVLVAEVLLQYSPLVAESLARADSRQQVVGACLGFDDVKPVDRVGSDDEARTDVAAIPGRLVSVNCTCGDHTDRCVEKDPMNFQCWRCCGDVLGLGEEIFDGLVHDAMLFGRLDESIVIESGVPDC